MAKVKRSALQKRKAIKPARRIIPAGGGIVLPVNYTEPGGELNDFSILIHGVKKIGKTSLAIQGAKALSLQFDPPQTAYRRLEIIIDKWKRFLDALFALERAAEKGTFPYTRVVVDRADLWYKYCEYWVMEKLAIEKMSEEGWGEAYRMAEREFDGAVSRLLRLPCGKWFLCHSVMEEEENRHGEDIIKLKPNLNKRADAVLNGRCDAWFAYVYEGSRRALVLIGDERTGAGHRIKHHFETPEGAPVELVPMGTSEEEAYENFLAAFNNEQASVNPFAEKKGEKKKLKIRAG